MRELIRIENRNPKFSASRFGTYNSCLWKYALSYIYQMTSTTPFPLAVKGTCFHHIAENTFIHESLESVLARAKDAVAQFDVDETKYPITKSIYVFYLWWKTYIEPLVADGYVLEKEHWENGELDGAPLCGAVDLLLINPKTKDVRIFDYKSGSSPHIGDYEGQLALYVYMVSKRLGISDEEISSKIRCFLFFPLANVKDLDVTNQKEIEKQMNKDMMEYSFGLSNIKEKLEEFTKIIEDTNNRDWSKIDPMDAAKSSFSCSFCGFSGHPNYCPLTHKMGMGFPRSSKILTKDESKEYYKKLKEGN